MSRRRRGRREAGVGGKFHSVRLAAAVCATGLALAAAAGSARAQDKPVPVSPPPGAGTSTEAAASKAGDGRPAVPPAERVSSDPKVDAKKNRAYPQWEIHDLKRPKPPIVTPGTFSSQEQPGQPPSDAVILFDGKDLSKWTAGKDQAPTWKVENGYMEAAGGKSIQTKEPLGDVHLHLEFATPTEVKGTGQGRGNSGVLLMSGTYEVQVLDSYDNETYADGQAAALYGQNPPMANASRGPGQWQVYDILFRGPRFDDAGKLLRPARVTVMHNGVFVQDNWVFTGGTGHHVQPAYKKHPEKMPLGLQFHGNPTRFRNIWYRELPEEGYPNKAEQPAKEKAKESAEAPAAK